SIPADALRRKGYRLPTEPEWEYSCRAGAGTSRYYGLSTQLLPKYAWYQANSKDRAWPAGNLLPNDLGLFDMLGNVYEWCQDRYESYQPVGTGTVVDDIKTLNKIDIITSRLLRSGSFKTFSANLRSAYRFGPEPVVRRGDYGLRLARTYD